MTTPPDIFLSYSRDDQARAKLFAEAFEREGFRVWWDVGLRTGESYDEVTETALRTAKAVVVLWSKKSVTSRWVRAEATLADRNKTLVPAMIEVCDRPIMFELTQTAELMHWLGDERDPAFLSFLDDVRRFVGPALVAAPQQAPAVRGNLPRRLAPLIGREAELSQIASLLKEAPLVTLTGPGGIGKTRLAIEAAQRLAGEHPDGAFLVELAGVSDAAGIPATIARSMGIELRSDPDAEIIERLRAWQALIVLDNCEHLVEAAAGLVERVLQAAPAVRILTTSQEILGVEGERVVRLRSLGEEDAHALFLRAARAADPDYAAGAADEAAIRAICTRLDGVALAIEMAGAQAPAMGCAELMGALEDRFRVLTAGRRTALPRQRTLQATLDWSHGLLSADEAAVFRRLSVFAGGCALEAARDVLAEGALDARAVTAALASLSRKSLIVVERSGNVPRYRLLETMRAYAQQRLLDAGEIEALRQRHAGYFAGFFEPVLEVFSQGGDGWIRGFEAETDNLSAALEWCFSESGNREHGCRLAADGCMVFLFLSRFAEPLKWVEIALTHGDLLPKHVRERLMAARTYIHYLHLGRNQILLEETARHVTPGSDRMARCLVVSTTLINLGMQPDYARAAKPLLEELHGIGFGERSYPALLHNQMLVNHIMRLSPPEPALLRQQTDAAVKKARACGSNSFVFYACALGSGEEVPWNEDRDRAISAARSMVEAVLARPERLVRANALPMLSGRLVVELCERNAPGDIDAAHAIVEGVCRRIGLSGPGQLMWLFPLAWMQGRRREAVLLLGSVRHYLRDFDFQFMKHWVQRIEAAYPPEEFQEAIAEGAGLTPLETLNLLLPRNVTEGAARG
jgi:predicted ATPase